jgi:hypothetical protein
LFFNNWKKDVLNMMELVGPRTLKTTMISHLRSEPGNVARNLPNDLTALQLLEKMETYFGDAMPLEVLETRLQLVAQKEHESISHFSGRLLEAVANIQTVSPTYFLGHGGVEEYKRRRLGAGLLPRIRDNLLYLLNDPAVTYDDLLKSARTYETNKELEEGKKKITEFPPSTKKTDGVDDAIRRDRYPRYQPKGQLVTQPSRFQSRMTIAEETVEEPMELGEPRDQDPAETDSNLLDDVVSRLANIGQLVQQRRGRTDAGNQCFYCHEVGHFKRECPKLQNQQQPSGNGPEDSGKKGTRVPQEKDRKEVATSAQQTSASHK